MAILLVNIENSFIHALIFNVACISYGVYVDEYRDPMVHTNITVRVLKNCPLHVLFSQSLSPSLSLSLLSLFSLSP